MEHECNTTHSLSDHCNQMYLLTAGEGKRVIVMQSSRNMWWHGWDSHLGTRRPADGFSTCLWVWLHCTSGQHQTTCSLPYRHWD